MPRESPLEMMFRLQLTANKIEGWEQEYRFHSERKWRFDFAFPEKKIAVELQGGTWSRGGHARGSGIEKDCEKFSHAAILGWSIILADTNQVKNGQGIDWLIQALGNRDQMELF